MRSSVVIALLVLAGCVEVQRNPDCRNVTIQAWQAEEAFWMAPEDTLSQAAFLDAVYELALPEGAQPPCRAEEAVYLSIVQNNARIATGRYQAARDSANALLRRVVDLPDSLRQAYRARLLRHRARSELRLGLIDEAIESYGIARRYVSALGPLERWHLEIYAAESYEARAKRDSALRPEQTLRDIERARDTYDRAIEVLESWRTERTTYKNHLIAHSLRRKAAMIERYARVELALRRAQNGAGMDWLLDWRFWFVLAFAAAIKVAVDVAIALGRLRKADS